MGRFKPWKGLKELLGERANDVQSCYSHQKQLYFTQTPNGRDRDETPKFFCQVCGELFDDGTYFPEPPSDRQFWDCAQMHDTLLHPHR